MDIVIEAGGRLLPIEVKASGRPRLGDARHLRTFRAEYGKKTRAELLLHTGGNRRVACARRAGRPVVASAVREGGRNPKSEIRMTSGAIQRCGRSRVATSPPPRNVAAIEPAITESLESATLWGGVVNFPKSLLGGLLRFQGRL